MYTRYSHAQIQEFPAAAGGCDSIGFAHGSLPQTINVSNVKGGTQGMFVSFGFEGFLDSDGLAFC